LDAVEDAIRGQQRSEQLAESVCRNVFWHKLAKQKQVVLFNRHNSLQKFWPEAPAHIFNFIGISVVTGNKTPAALGLVNKKNRNFTAGDVKLVTAVSEQIKAIIDSFRFYRELIVQERIRRELEIAAEIQESLLPKTLPEFRGLTIGVSSLPAFEVGGDFYDFISPDEAHLTVIVGDVAGKGVPAAMFTSMVRTLLKIEALHSQDPHTILQKVNEVLWQDLWQAELFITAIVVTFDKKNGALMYANAGHVPGIIYHAKSNTSRLLKATSLPIGIFGYASKTTQYVHLSPGDTLALYSDGVSEASNPAGEQPRADRFTQSETSLTRNEDGSVICAAYNDSYDGLVSGQGFTGFSSSTDKGVTWTDHGGIGSNSSGDPANVWSKRDNTFYHASLHTNGLGLWSFGTTCATSTFVSMIHTGANDDKELMAVDNNPSSPYYGRLYVAWTDFNNGHIYVTVSDNATTWSTPVDISGKGDIQGAWPVIDPATNDIYAAWVHWDSDDIIDIEIVRSTDGGATWAYVSNPADNVTKMQMLQIFSSNEPGLYQLKIVAYDEAGQASKAVYWNVLIKNPS
jgi:hypothetical protein